MDSARPTTSVRRSPGEAGLALALVLLTINVILIVTATLVAIALNEYQAAASGERSRQAFQLAEAGLEKAIYELKRDLDWTDSGASAAATRNLNDPREWAPLWDGSANLVDTPFPAGATIGEITVELCRDDNFGDGNGCPGVPAPTVAGCTPNACIWVRATGRIPGLAARQIEFLLSQMAPGYDLINYSASPINIGAGGGGNGSFILHGSLYIASCLDPDGGGPQPCVGLVMQGDGAILNDVPYPTPGDPDTTPPYNNKVYVVGQIQGQGNSWQIGLDSQPMQGVYATLGWSSGYENQIDALDKGTVVPFVPFPDPSKLCEPGAPGDPPRCLMNRLNLPPADGGITPINADLAYVCTAATCTTAASWTPVYIRGPLADPLTPLRLSANNPTRTRVVIPDRNPDGSPAVNCTTTPSTCNVAAGTGSVNGSGNFSLVYNGYAGAGQVNLWTQSGADAFIHTTKHVRIDGDVRYAGRTTFLIENADDVGAAMPALEIRGSVTPLCRASQTTCAQTFGQANGDTYAFAVGPKCTGAPPSGSLVCTPTGGGVYVRGSGIELNLVVLAHGTLKNDNPQTWYGMFIAGLLDWDNNPSIYPVANLKANLPPGIAPLAKPGFGLQITRWREVF
ncbi:MAG: hypothetical protein QN203_09555 [Armatimonadota bacterium]|nr:hypothetical protein [Armatimonadota bacterium]